LADARKPETLISTLLKSIDDQTQGGLKADDVTALLLRPNGTAARTNVRNALTAPWRILASDPPAPSAGRGPMSAPRVRLPTSAARSSRRSIAFGDDDASPAGRRCNSAPA